MTRNRNRKSISQKRAREEEEEEYEVEKIKSHKILTSNLKNGKSILKYLVKWKGYSDKDNTWEPADSLANATDLVNEYWEIYGGEEKRNEVMELVKGKSSQKSKRGSTAKKTKLQKQKPSGSKVEEDEESDSDYSESEVNDKNFRTNADWKDIVKVKAVKYSEKGQTLEGVVRWADGKLGLYPTSLIAAKSPLKLVDFYEKFLAFES